MKEYKRKERYTNGYRLIYKPNYYLSKKEGANKGYIYEHIYVATKEIGRPLNPDEVVHHLDHDRSNNDVSNLIVLSRSHHAKLHHWLRCFIATKSLKLNSKNCEICGKRLRVTLKYCTHKCYLKGIARNIPTKETLMKDIKTHKSISSIGRYYGVSDNAVRKWLKKYSLPLKIFYHS